MASRPQPYPDDVSFLLDAFGWIRARTRRIEGERESQDSMPSRRGTVGSTTGTAQQEQRRRLGKLRDTETAAKRLLDDRLAAHRQSAPPLGLDAIAKEHDLSEFERCVVQLATLAGCGERYGTYLSGCVPYHWGGSITPEVVWAFLELGLGDRLKTRASFLPTAALVRGGIVTLNVGPDWSPETVAPATVEVTASAFARVVGVPALAPKSGGTDGSPF